ncbi:unnamed protein product [Blepharisma stoltei]|uniref:Cache domain-containing protein n=1 Tax=Blepharisma stoltei TaxID=1481888 RepID=A0AAU9INP7_9CILI|nr:unnamed protein product [Blepharisma stoltei]
MKCKEEYSGWSLGRQLQVSFVTTTFFLSAVLVLITKFQLDWLRDSLLSKTHDVLANSITDQMGTLAREKSAVVEQELDNDINFVKQLKELDKTMLGWGNYKDPIIVPNAPIMDNDISSSSLSLNEYGVKVTYATGVFQTRIDPISTDGELLMNNSAAMDQIYPVLNRKKYLAMYAGFATDEIIHYYPGKIFSDSSYTPIVQEWYYSAINKEGSIIITEPYTDTDSEKLIFSISTAIANAKGVSGIDVLASSLQQPFINVTILDSGFMFLISSGGVVIYAPESWAYMGTAFRIYDQTLTGISQGQWNRWILDPDPYNRFSFSDINGTEYYAVINPVYPANMPNITHYVMSCAVQSETEDMLDSISNNYQNTYYAIFFMILGIAVAVFIVITTCAYFITRKTSRQLKNIETVFSRITHKGLFPNLIKGIGADVLLADSSGMKNLMEASLDKVDKIRDLEDQYESYEWGLTRPADKYLFTRWNERLYPLNWHNEKQMSWRHVLPKLTKIGQETRPS